MPVPSVPEHSTVSPAPSVTGRAETAWHGRAGAGHRGRRVLVTIVPFVPQNGTGAASGAHDRRRVPRLVLRDATVLDADGARPRTDVAIEERRISLVRTGAPVETGPGDRVVDLDGRTVMPGMVSSHFHATYHELGSKTAPFGLEEPPALQAVRAAHHLELLLRSGFTGAVSAGAPFAIDASMKAAIAEGLFPVPG